MNQLKTIALASLLGALACDLPIEPIGGGTDGSGPDKPDTPDTAGAEGSDSGPVATGSGTTGSPYSGGRAEGSGPDEAGESDSTDTETTSTGTSGCGDFGGGEVGEAGGDSGESMCDLTLDQGQCDPGEFSIECTNDDCTCFLDGEKAAVCSTTEPCSLQLLRTCCEFDIPDEVLEPFGPGF